MNFSQLWYIWKHRPFQPHLSSSSLFDQLLFPSSPPQSHLVPLQSSSSPPSPTLQLHPSPFGLLLTFVLFPWMNFSQLWCIWKHRPFQPHLSSSLFYQLLFPSSRQQSLLVPLHTSSSPPSPPLLLHPYPYGPLLTFL
ncbi:hypothetical protein RchiOBHm_Chr5g0024591 [Rosa chinensis]|uniref:Uncharacterized protein n=1 Tax=Rosa chinensis TaxID=74649 RepID=A0A2P6Q8C5_ROSCH|nr:hypothetical protein RchiOBHm_Chr5g0024591 [Rosa chinensis]